MDNDPRSARPARPDIPRVVGLAWQGGPMSVSPGSRDAILGRVRQATPNRPRDHAESYRAVERNYVRAGRLGQQERLALMIERLREYDAEVVETTPASLPDAIAAQLAASGRHTFVAPPGLAPEWLVPGFEWKIDDRLTTEDIEKTDGVVTASFCGIADSGTIVSASLAQRGPAHHHAAAGLAPVRVACQRRGRDPAGVLRALLRTSSPGHVYLRSQRHGGYRDDAHQGRARAAVPARHPGAG